MLSKTLITIFILLVVYGLLTFQYGPAIIAAIAAVFYHWADKRMSHLETINQTSNDVPESES